MSSYLGGEMSPYFMRQHVDVRFSGSLRASEAGIPIAVQVVKPDIMHNPPPLPLYEAFV